MKAETERIHAVLVGFWLNQLKQKKVDLRIMAAFLYLSCSTVRWRRLVR